MKKYWLYVCGVGAVFAIATALAADKKPDVNTPSEIAELRQEVRSLQARIKALEDKLDKLEPPKIAATPKPPQIFVLPPAIQRRFVLPGTGTPLSEEFAHPDHPPKIWGEGECNGWKYYMIPLSCDVASK